MYKKWSKQITAMVMALAMLLSAMGVFAADANDTILSETFEGNVSTWQLAGNTTFVTDVKHGESGQSLKLDGGIAKKTFFAPDSEGYEPGTYTFTCWVYLTAASANPFTVYTSKGTSSFEWATSVKAVAPASLGTTYGQWVKIREKMVIAEGQKSIYIEFTPRNGYYVDDISITKGYSMIENTGFEDDLNGWTLGSQAQDGQIAVTTEQKHSGNKALKVHANATDTSVGANVMAMYPVAVTPGKTYTVSFWVYAGEGLTLASTMQLFACKAATYTTWGDAGANLAMTPAKTVNQKWVKLTGTITTTGTTNYLQIVFIKRTNDASYYIDDITVDEVATGVRIEKNDEGTLYGLDAVEAGAWQVTGHLAGEDASAMVVAAVYKVSGDVRSLVSVDIQPATNAADGLANVTVPEDDGEYEIKAMLWEDMTGLSPRLRTVTLS